MPIVRFSLPSKKSPAIGARHVQQLTAPSGARREHHLQCLVPLRGPAQTLLLHWLFRMHGDPLGCTRDLPLRQIPPWQYRDAHSRFFRQWEPSAFRTAKLGAASSITRPPARTRRCTIIPSFSPFVCLAVTAGLRTEQATPARPWRVTAPRGAVPVGQPVAFAPPAMRPPAVADQPSAKRSCRTQALSMTISAGSIAVRQASSIAGSESSSETTLR